MSNPNISQLNTQFGIKDKITFSSGPGGLTVAVLKGKDSEARVALMGAHVMYFQPKGEEPVLWMSNESYFEPGKPIRGGIPVCWPWFGPHPEDSSKPAHGFARIMEWKVLQTKEFPDGNLQIKLGLNSNEETKKYWKHDFRLEMLISSGKDLHLALTTYNSNEQSIECGIALHSYFTIGNIENISVTGLEDTQYFDKLDGSNKTQKGKINITAETDRIYKLTTSDCLIIDPDLKRKIRIAKAGSRSTVVWNPWIDKSKKMPDFGDKEYIGMICVETTNASDDVAIIPSGEAHTIKTVISVEK